MPAGSAGSHPRRMVFAAAGLAHAVLMLAAFEPWSLWACALAAPIPLLWAGRHAGTGRRAIVPALLTGLGTAPFWATEHWWLRDVTAVGYPLLVLHLMVYPAVFVLVMSRVPARRPWWMRAWPVLAAVVWAGLDFFRGAVAWGGYPWFFVSHPLIDAPILSWPAAVLGVEAVTFLVVLGGAMAVHSHGRPKPSSRRWAVAALGLMAVWAGVGLLRDRGLARSPATSPPVRVAAVQTNVPQDNRRAWQLSDRLADLGRFLELSRAAASTGPDLIAWPETMFPGAALDPASAAVERASGLAYTLPGRADPVPISEFADRLLAEQAALGVPMIVGAIGYDNLRFDPAPGGGFDRRSDAAYNSAMVVSGGLVQPGRYDKLHLTPFGEVMPLISRWPWLERQLLALGARGMAFDLSAGRSPVVLSVAGRGGRTVRAATPICFEAAMPGVCRRLVWDGARRRADLIVNLTNDGWFGASDAGRAHHLMVARWRALELATPVVRVANTGISCFIDDRGRVTRPNAGAPGPREPGWLAGEVVPGARITLWMRVGPIFGWAMLILSVAAVVWPMADRFRRRPDARTAGSRAA